MKLFNKKIPSVVWYLGLVSLFTDIASEMLYPVIPIFLTQVLGASVLTVGIIEGFAEGTSSLFKVIMGYWSDSLQKRKPFVVAGYAASAAGKVIIAFSQTWTVVYIGKLVDRIGKGTRTGARDALLLEASETSDRGLIFGLHRSMDSAGAVIGPAISLLLLSIFNNNIRLILYIATIPTLLSLFLFFYVKEARKKIKTSKLQFTLSLKQFPTQFNIFLLGLAVFTLGNSSDSFLILKSKSLGLSLILVITAYILYNLVYTLVSAPAGEIADKIGTKRVFLVGLLIYILVYLGFAFNRNPLGVWPLFAVYGFYIALTDGVSKAIAGSLIHNEQSGTAYGIMYTVTSIFTLLASVIGGILWSFVSPSATFIFGAVCAVISFAILAQFLLTPPQKGEPSDKISDTIHPFPVFKKIIISVIIFMLFLVSILIMTIMQQKNPTNNMRVKKTSINDNTKHPRQKFATSKYAPFALQIAPGEMSNDTKQALAHFVLQENKLPDGSVEVKIKPAFYGYSFRTFLVKPGYKMYFAALPDQEGDINDSNEIDYLSRDVPILVDENGYILNL